VKLKNWTHFVFVCVRRAHAWAFHNSCSWLPHVPHRQIPSIKNFQLISPELGDHNVQIQFGKVSGHRYILDYKEPILGIQAFAMALCQFVL
jgi:hypothetical protein